MHLLVPALLGAVHEDYVIGEFTQVLSTLYACIYFW